MQRIAAPAWQLDVADAVGRGGRPAAGVPSGSRPAPLAQLDIAPVYLSTEQEAEVRLLSGASERDPAGPHGAESQP